MIMVTQNALGMRMYACTWYTMVAQDTCARAYHTCMRMHICTYIYMHMHIYMHVRIHRPRCTDLLVRILLSLQEELAGCLTESIDVLLRGDRQLLEIDEGNVAFFVVGETLQTPVRFATRSPNQFAPQPSIHSTCC